jgi:succinate dehydrogenase / fumarate reductase cytochrome b subunit
MASATGEIRHPKGPPKRQTSQTAGPFLWAFFESTVGAKMLVALTGVGLTLFTLFHMLGNLKLFQGPEAINHYAHFLKNDLGVLIWIARASLLAIFVLHIVLAVRLTLRSRAARRIPYQFHAYVQATTASRTMIWSGLVLGLFIVFHLAHFTFGWVMGVEVAPGQYVNYLNLRDAHGDQDVYTMVVAAFRNPVISFLYIVSQLALFLHLSHGIQSSFQTLGLKNRRFVRAIRIFGVALAATIALGNVGIVAAVQAGVVRPIYPLG